MIRFVASAVIAALLLGAVSPASAQDKAVDNFPAPSKAVADAWAREQAGRPSARAQRGLEGVYVGLQAADIWTTFVGRQRGAREVNPLMNTNYKQALGFKTLTTAATLLATRKLAKKSPKTALATMVALNVMMGAVVANNIKVSRH